MTPDWNLLEHALKRTADFELDCEQALAQLPQLVESWSRLEPRVEALVYLEAHLGLCGCCQEVAQALVRALDGRSPHLRSLGTDSPN